MAYDTNHVNYKSNFCSFPTIRVIKNGYLKNTARNCNDGSRRLYVNDKPWVKTH